MRRLPDFYRVLHVQADAPAAIIRTSYRTLMQSLKMHPDLGGDHGRAALLNEAFATLRDPEKRAAYDRAIAVETATQDDDLPAPAAGPPPAGHRPQDAPRQSASQLSTGKLACLFCGAGYSPHEARDPESECWSCKSPICPTVRQNGTLASGRSLDRMPKQLAVTVTRAAPESATWQTTTEDLSINGARFVSAVLLDAGQRLRLDSSFCTAVGIVRHVQADLQAKPPVWKVGMEFVTLRIKQPRGVFISTQA